MISKQTVWFPPWRLRLGLGPLSLRRRATSGPSLWRDSPVPRLQHPRGTLLPSCLWMRGAGAPQATAGVVQPLSLLLHQHLQLKEAPGEWGTGRRALRAAVMAKVQKFRQFWSCLKNLHRKKSLLSHAQLLRCSGFCRKPSIVLVSPAAVYKGKSSFIPNTVLRTI